MENDLSTIWDFVVKYYPNYDHSNEIAYSDDLQKIIDGEDDEDSAARRIFVEDFDSDMEKVQIEYDSVHRKIYETAILEYQKTLSI